MPEGREASQSQLHVVHASTIDTLGTKHQTGSIVRNLEKINDLEKKASHLQKPFLPGPVVTENNLVKEKKRLTASDRRINSSTERGEADRRNSLQSSGRQKESFSTDDNISSPAAPDITIVSSASEEYSSAERPQDVQESQDHTAVYKSSPRTTSPSQFEPHKRIPQPILHFYEASLPSSTSPPSPVSSTAASTPTSHPSSSSSSPLQAENVQVPISSHLRSESSHQKATNQSPTAQNR